MPLYSLKDRKEEAGHRTISLLVTDGCSLQCINCFERHRSTPSRVMDFEVAREAVSYYLNLDDEFDTVAIDLFGGEPLEAFSLIKEIVEWCIKQTWKKKFHFFIGTNGTLLNPGNKKWFIRHKEHLTLGISINGNRKAHNISRSNSYDLIYPHIEFFKIHWPTQPAKMTICAETIPFVAESVIDLEEKGIFFTANIPFENIWGTPENKSKLLEIYREQLTRLVDYYVENSHLYPVYPMLGILPSYLGIPLLKMNDENVRYCGAGYEMISIDIDGQRYPCHRFMPFVTGRNTHVSAVNRQSEWRPEECRRCKIVHSCPTCAGYNWEENNDTGIRTTYHCEAHKMEVLAAAKIAALRLNKIPLSQLESLTQEDRGTLNDRVKSLLELVRNGI